MLFPIRKLLEMPDRPALACILASAKVQEALKLMRDNDFTQLPVVNDDGYLVGMISEQTIVRDYERTKGNVALFDLPVSDCTIRAVTLPRDEDIVEALERLDDTGAIIIVEQNKPVGIITDYDTTRFFRDLAEWIVLVEDIEVSLRQYIKQAFPDDRAMEAALGRAFKWDSEGRTPKKSFGELNFHDHIQLIVSEGNWSRFNGIFEPQKFFRALLDPVGKIRNDLAHFRGRLTEDQRETLQRARQWMKMRPALVSTEHPAAQLVTVTDTDAAANKAEPVSEEPEFNATEEAYPELNTRVGGKYGPLHRYLLKKGEEGESRIQLKFEGVETILGSAMPTSANDHRSWWANDSTGHTQSRAWLRAGWRVEDVNFLDRTVTFERFTDPTVQQQA